MAEDRWGQDAVLSICKRALPGVVCVCGTGRKRGVGQFINSRWGALVFAFLPMSVRASRRCLKPIWVCMFSPAWVLSGRVLYAVRRLLRKRPLLLPVKCRVVEGRLDRTRW